MRRVHRLSAKRQLWRLCTLSQRQITPNMQAEEMRETHRKEGRTPNMYNTIKRTIKRNPPHKTIESHCCRKYRKLDTYVELFKGNLSGAFRTRYALSLTFSHYYISSYNMYSTYDCVLSQVGEVEEHATCLLHTSCGGRPTLSGPNLHLFYVDV